MDLYVTALGQMKIASWIGGEGQSLSGNVLGDDGLGISPM